MAYERDILDDAAAKRQPTRFTNVEVRLGLVVEDRSSGFCGDVVRWNNSAVTLRDRHQHLRHFTWKPGGFLHEGRPVTLVRPAAAPDADAQRVTASGSVGGAASGASPARVARASRIWVEGIHDAELLEQVWGADLRDLGIVVEPMHGADGLADAVAEFRPGPGRRLGVLLDHLVAGSKETRLAADVHARHGDSLLVTGHPFVDVWAGVRPGLVGLDEWPTVDRSVPWKEGVCRALGADAARFWPQLRERVRSYADLRPELVGAVERLIDFVEVGADVGAGDGPDD